MGNVKAIEGGIRNLNHCVADFARAVDELTRIHISLWHASSSEWPHLGQTYDVQQQQDHLAYCEQFMESVERALTRYPHSRRGQDRWRAHIAELAREFCTQCLGYSRELIDVLFTDQNLGSTREFVRRATEFDRQVDVDELHQALRNVWVMNSIQQLLGGPVRCTPSVFAYSMLYPYTDNVLDDATLTQREKRNFNEWLEQRLQGRPVRSESCQEHALSELVRMIEMDHHRDQARPVFESLLAIHRAQQGSLVQQSSSTLSSRDLLELSVRKGGTSVLAHGYLVNETLHERDVEFVFGYGVFLQLLDDLQDVVTDSDHHHHTLFTEERRNRTLDRLVSRLYSFMIEVLQGVSEFPVSNAPAMRELIHRNCCLLMLQAIAQHRDLFCPDFVEQISIHSPLPMNYLARCPQLIRDRYSSAKRVFQQRHRMKSIYETLG